MATDCGWQKLANNANNMEEKVCNCLMVLGPTAVGKTALAVKLADFFGGEIISADSRQVYRGLDIGSGKDLCEYELHNPDRLIPYHLIDVTDLDTEYSVFDYQQSVYKVFPEIKSRNKAVVFCGGTGMYLDSIVRGYRLTTVPCNVELRNSLAGKTDSELAEYLADLKGGKLHNTTDTVERHRVLRAIEIEVYSRENPVEMSDDSAVPEINPFIIGTTFDRKTLRERIGARLSARFQEDMIGEVSALHDKGVSWERLERLGLEYRFIAEYLQGKIAGQEELRQSLYIAIGQFAKRQETWFRRMEKQGTVIHWLPAENRFENAKQLIQTGIESGQIKL